ncbi:MAG: two-component regulator propeller domain-containing protein, partial [Chitinophagales bacterium]
GGVTTFFESKDHSIWVGTDEGVSRWNPLQEKFAVIQLPASFIGTTNVSAIAEDAHGTVWMGSFDVDTLYAIIQPNSQLRKLALSDNMHSANRKIYITSLLTAANGAVYVGSSVGVFIIDEKEKKLFLQQPGYKPHVSSLQKNSTMQSLVSNMVSSLEEDDDGNIWIGTGMGVNRYRPLSKKCDRVLYSILPDEVNPSFIIRHLKAATDGTVWAATDNGLFGINARTLTNKLYQSVDALPGSRFLFIHESNDRQLLWIGTEQGLLSFDIHSKQFKSYPQSGNDLSVTSILEDEKGNLWISSQHGITRFHPETGDSKKFSVENGLKTNRFSENASCVAKDGLFYFGSEKGFQSFYPDSISVNTTVPPVVITDFRLFNQSIFAGKETQLVNEFLRSKKMTLKYNQNFFSIDFAALNYNDAEANTYAYQLVGIDKDWVMAGNSRTATYTNIAPDCYTFKVKGANNHGVWNDEGASFDLIITPPWWKTWWFYSLCTIAIVSALYALYRYRISQIKKVFSIRSKIARDLHDDIGSTLSSISMMSQLAKEGSDHHNKEEELFETISTASKEAMELMSVIVWSVNPNNDKLSNILIRMREYASDILEACNIELNISLDEEVKDFIIPMEKRKDFYLIFKEAVNNVAKYSKAVNAVIQLSREHGKMIMSITDDGHGFEVEKLRSGNGLVNMKERAKSIGGMLEITSEIGKGTSVRLEMPIVT